MTSKEEKERCKLLSRQVKQSEREIERARLPLNNTAMHELFDYVDEKLSATACDHTLTHTHAFLSTAGLPLQKVITWLEEHGGYCDCEVIANAEEAWEEIVRGA
ncbi:MAG TPA: DUF2695 domain-containing protein [Terriglobales bacterium]|jgi:hypothetical protein|nr:DUF2695 domain-containing protein [Terriglobales bacterium]